MGARGLTSQIHNEFLQTQTLVSPLNAFSNSLHTTTKLPPNKPQATRNAVDLAQRWSRSGSGFEF